MWIGSLKHRPTSTQLIPKLTLSKTGCAQRQGPWRRFQHSLAPISHSSPRLRPWSLLDRGVSCSSPRPVSSSLAPHSVFSVPGSAARPPLVAAPCLKISSCSAKMSWRESHTTTRALGAVKLRPRWAHNPWLTESGLVFLSQTCSQPVSAV